MKKMVNPWNFEGATCWGINTDLFFPEIQGMTVENKQAQAICKDCPWLEECLTYALHYGVTGIWGGTTTNQRHKIRKKLNIISKPITDERYAS